MYIFSNICIVFSYQIEIYKKELEQAKSTVERQEKSLQLLAKTSEAAFEEHAALRNDFEKEFYEKNAAVKVATTVSYVFSEFQNHIRIDVIIRIPFLKRYM